MNRVCLKTGLDVRSQIADFLKKKYLICLWEVRPIHHTVVEAVGRVMVFEREGLRIIQSAL